jgi:hypothetical protein
MSRSSIYSSYKKTIKQEGLKQQLFLQKYVIENDIDRLLLFHGIGTGKTRSSILIAEALMKQNSDYKVNVILPARLKTNYIDELITYMDTIPKLKKLSLKEKEKYYKKKYEILSYEYIINLFKKSTNIKKTLKDFTKNRILIIDEFHNLITNHISNDDIENIYKKNKLSVVKNIRGLIMRFISKYADPSCKMFFLSATPVFDNYRQFIELVKLLNTSDIDVTSISQLIPYLKGKVTYYSTTDKQYFPKVVYKEEKVPLSIDQMKQTLSYQDNKENEDSESFLIKQRQIAISLYDEKKVNKVIGDLDRYAPKLKLLFELLDKYQGKHLIYSNFISRCLKIIQKYLDTHGWVNYLDGKYKKYKTYILWDGSLKDENKIKIKEILNSKKNIDGKYIRVILGSPSIKEGISFKHIQHLHQIDPVWNISAKNQIEGRCIRYKSHDDIQITDSYLKREVVVHNYIGIKSNDDIILDKSKFKNILKEAKKHRIFIYNVNTRVADIINYMKDNNWIQIDKIKKTDKNIYAFILDKKLLENKKIKIFFSNKKINNFDGKIYDMNELIIQNESLEIPEEFMTCDERIYYNIMPKKEKIIKKIEEILKKTAIDYYLYKSLSQTPSDSTSIRLSSDADIIFKSSRKNPKTTIKNTCPFLRRPINNKCPLGNILKINKHGHECCYIDRKKKI